MSTFAERLRQADSTSLLRALGICLVLAAGGCGGGGAGAKAGAPAPVGAPDPNAGSVTVNVTDALGEPVQATVDLGSLDGRPTIRRATNDVGVATFDNVLPGDKWVDAFSNFPVPAGQYVPSITLVPKGRLDVAMALDPRSQHGTFGIGSSIVNERSADGRTLEFTLPIVDVSEASSIDVLLMPCAPNLGNDTPTHRADCVSGATNFDAAYEADNAGAPLEVATSGGEQTPFAAGLLLDQSESFVGNDPWDARLFGAKYFLHSSTLNDRVALAAFASDNVAAGKLSALPQKPLTIYPTADPRFLAPERDAFPTVDSLAQLEGGESSLYQSIGAMLDFIEVEAPSGKRRALVLVTHGRDETCGSTADCQNAEQAVIAKSRSSAAPIITVGLADSVHGDGPALSRLAEGTGGVAFWADNSDELGKVFGALPAVLDTRVETNLTRFRIQSSTPGAFQPGYTVFGTLQFQICPWDCYVIERPFAVRIP